MSFGDSVATCALLRAEVRRAPPGASAGARLSPALSRAGSRTTRQRAGQTRVQERERREVRLIDRAVEVGWASPLSGARALAGVQWPRPTMANSNVAKSAEARKRNEAKKAAEGKGGGGRRLQLVIVLGRPTPTARRRPTRPAPSATAQARGEGREGRGGGEARGQRGEEGARHARWVASGAARVARRASLQGFARAWRSRRESDGAQGSGALPTRERRTTCSRPASKIAKKTPRRRRSSLLSGSAE